MKPLGCQGNDGDTCDIFNLNMSTKVNASKGGPSILIKRKFVPYTS